MKTIWKIELKLVDEQVIELPASAHHLCVQLQDGKPCLWSQVRTEAGKEKYRVFVCGTGNEMPDSVQHTDHVGTVQTGQYVWHIFVRQDLYC